ncbi:hypothetical protein AU381_00105 [Sinorhizobium glycinis]|uniref:Ubiquitin carboxyl-hydrolase n=1 Tax=Sinorhizobium glycinis TaxID=1472378 RepID=A0A178Y0V6_9HYPH|nr:transposase [Sinorhizobium glycinis]OAP40365.1 hypothetical protein AU381_00105 [Sinorhizobium glycinis]
MAKKGRPTEYTPELAAKIVERIASGDSLRKICRSVDMPHESTVRLWATQDRNGFYTQYTRAREAQMDSLAEDLLEIADDDKNDVNRARLRVDTRKWLMSKIAPKRFGDRVAKEISGPNGGPVRFDVSGMTDEQLAALETALGGIAIAAGEDAGDHQG